MVCMVASPRTPFIGKGSSVAGGIFHQGSRASVASWNDVSHWSFIQTQHPQTMCVSLLVTNFHVDDSVSYDFCKRPEFDFTFLSQNPVGDLWRWCHLSIATQQVGWRLIFLAEIADGVTYAPWKWLFFLKTNSTLFQGYQVLAGSKHKKW